MKKLTGRNKSLMGMVHVPALPGTPNHSLSISEIIKFSLEEAVKIEAAGFDAIIIENMHDRPYLKKKIGPEITAVMTAVAFEITKAVKIPLGIQILAGANKEALASAHASGAKFIRAEGFVFAHTADEGIIESDAGELLRYRKAIGAEELNIFVDIKKKHSSHSLTADTTLAETAHAAEFFLSDGLIITGTATGFAAKPEDVMEAKSASNLPILIGSGLTPENLKDYWDITDGFIIGSWIKENGDWTKPVDPVKSAEIVDQAEILRNN